jgi:hypothetical protein
MLARAGEALVGRWRPGERGLEQPFVPTVTASELPSRKEGPEMFNLPIDTSAMTFLVGAGAEPIRERGTNRPRTDAETGEPLFAVQLVALIEGRANVITVKVPGEPPTLPQAHRSACWGSWRRRGRWRAAPALPSGRRRSSRWGRTRAWRRRPKRRSDTSIHSVLGGRGTAGEWPRPSLPPARGDLLVLKRVAVFLGLVLLIVVAPSVAVSISRAMLEAIVHFLQGVLAGGPHV